MDPRFFDSRDDDNDGTDRAFYKAMRSLIPLEYVRDIVTDRPMTEEEYEITMANWCDTMQPLTEDELLMLDYQEFTNSADAPKHSVKPSERPPVQTYKPAGATAAPFLAAWVKRDVGVIKAEIRATVKEFQDDPIQLLGLVLVAVIAAAIWAAPFLSVGY